MFDTELLLKLAYQLADCMNGLRPGLLFTSATGGSNQSSAQQDLQRACAELIHGVRTRWERQAVQDKLNTIEGKLQNATAIGLLADVDLQKYLGLIDDMHAALDQTN